MFDEYDDKAHDIMIWYEKALNWFTEKYNIKFKDPPHDMARRFLDEIIEFVPIDKGGTGG